MKETAEAWGVSRRYVNLCITEERIPGVVKVGNMWLIPKGAQKPASKRLIKQPPRNSLSADLVKILEATIKPMPRDNPDAILETVKEERLRLHFECELAYLRGDFELIKQCYRKTEGDDVSRLRASSVAIAAAISKSDYPFYIEIESYLKSVIQKSENKSVIAFAELCLSNACLGAAAPNMAPDWLKNGDFTSLHDKAIPDAVYKRSKYFQFIGRFESMLTAAETALVYSGSGKQEFTFHDIYFRIVCAIACCALDRTDEADFWLSDALKIALPHGFITPFAESVPHFGGLLQKLLEQEYPAYVDAITKQWESTFPNWLSFHNHFTKNNITLILSLQEYQMAKLAVQEIPFKQIAERLNISPGTLNNKMQVIYQKLFISGKKDLSQYIL